MEIAIITGTRFSDIVTNPITVTISNEGSLGLGWAAAPVTYPYRVLTSSNLFGPWSVQATGLRFLDANGAYTDTDTNKAAKFYRISTP